MKVPRMYEKYRDDPVGLARDVFGVELWRKIGLLEIDQAEVAKAFARNRLVACRTGHKCGSTRLTALLAWWFALTRPGSTSLLMAATDRQLRYHLWVEVRKLRDLAVSRGFDLPTVGNRDLVVGDSQIVCAYTPEEAAGVSEPDRAYFVDNAGYVSDDKFEAADPGIAAGAKALLIGRPKLGDTESVFWHVFNSRNSFPEWARVSMSSEDVPSGRQGLATAEWVDRVKTRYGADNPMYQNRVTGAFV